MKFILSVLGCVCLLINQVLFFNANTDAGEKDFKNFYGIAWSGKPAENVTYAKQMGCNSIIISPSSTNKDYRNNPDCADLKYYLLDPQWYPQVLSNFSRYINTTETIKDDAKKFYNRYMVWKSNEPFPYNLATGYHPSNCSTTFSVMWDFQQQAVIDEVVENIVQTAKRYENQGQQFTCAGYIVDEPKLAGNFYRLAEKGKNVPTTLSSWTGSDSGLVHDAITHEYATYAEGMVAFYKKLKARMKEEFDHPKWIVQSARLYNEVDNSEWIYQIKNRADRDELTPDMLFQKSSGNTDFVDDVNNFNSGVQITKDMVGNSQSGEIDDYKNRLLAAKSGINGAWYNWLGRFSNTGDMPDFHGITEVYPRLKLIRCLPNWDNLNNVLLSERSWDGDVYQSTNSYASSEVIYSRHPKTGKLYAVFLERNGTVKLHTGETVTAVRSVDGYFTESDDGSDDVSIVGNEISLKKADNVGKGYVFTVSSLMSQNAETTSGGDTETTSDAETSNETVKTKWYEYWKGNSSSNSTYAAQITKKSGSAAVSKNTTPVNKQSASTLTEWQQVLIRTAAQKTAGLAGGSGGQLIAGITYAPSNPSVVYFTTDTAQIWKSTDGGVNWQLKNNGFGPNGAASIVVDPNDENHVLAAGNIMSGAVGPDTSARGIYRTTDGGNNWSLVKVTHFVKPGANQMGILFAFAGSSIYAGTYQDGLLKSTDGGSTWKGVAQSGGGTVLSGTYIYDVKVHPTSNATLFISSATGLYKVTDSSGSATVAKTGSGLPANPGMTVIDKNNPSIIYATAGTSGVYRSIDGGVTFSARNNGLSGALGSTANTIVISPTDPNCLYVSFQKWGNYVYHTSDGGANWVQASSMDEQNTDGWVNGSQFGYSTGLGVSTAREAIAIHPTNKNIAIVTGTGEQLKKTTDGGVTWKYSNNGYTGQRVGQYANYSGNTSIAWDKNNSNRFLFSTTDWRPYLTEDGGDVFKPLNIINDGGRTTTAVAISPSNPNLFIIGVGLQAKDQRLQVSRDGGNTWTIMTNTLDTAGFQFIAFHPQKTNTIYAGKYKSTDNGYTWTTLSKKVGAMFPGNGDIVYAVEGTTIYKSTNGGSTWTAPYPALGSGYVGEIKVDQNNQDKLYVAVRGRGVYIINGSTISLKDTANGLKANQFNVLDMMYIVQDPNNTDVLYTAGWYQSHGYSDGIYRSTDGGNTWTNISYNLGNPFTAWSINVNPKDSYVYIGSSCGTWKLPPPGTSTTDTTPPTITITSPTSANTYSTSQATIDLSGTAADDSVLSDVSWSNDRGGSGTATGTTSWSISGISLLNGDNVITVTAKDGSNNTGTDTVTVTYTGTSSTKTVTAAKVTSELTVDGNLNESSWNFSENTNKTVLGSPDNTTQFGVLWDNTYLYIGVQVQDNNLYNDSPDIYNDDSIEIYIDGDHNHGTTYDTNDRQYMKGYNNSSIWEKNNNTSGVLHAWSAISGGYSIEMAIPWTNLGITPVEDMTFGFDVGNNDDDNGSTRDGQTMWSGTANNYLNTSAFGDLTLGPPAPDTSAPDCTISINDGAVNTNSSSVTLTLSATDNVGVTDYYLSANATVPSASDTGWVSVVSTANYNARVPFTLNSGDGSKTVYVWYKDAAGNISTTASDSITLDTTAPAITITSPTSGSAYTTISSTVDLSGSASDNTSGVSSVTWSNDKGGSGAASGTDKWSISGISLSAGKNVLTVTVTDGAGNSGTTVITVTYDATPTVTTGLSTQVTSSTAILNGTVNANGLSTTVWFEYGVASGSYTNKTSTQSVSGTNESTISISISGLSASKTYYHRIVAQNSAGIKYGTEENFTTLDTTAPNGSISMGNSAAYTNSTLVTVNLSATDEVGVTGYFLSAGSTPPSASSTGWISVTAATSYNAGVSYTLSSGDGNKTVYVWYKDAAGNVSTTASVSITLDTTAPTITITSPTSGSTYATTSNTLSLSGSASDNTSGVGSVIWSSDKGGSGTASGTTGWSISGINLSGGDNVITVTATDNTGNAGTCIITVTYSIPSRTSTLSIPYTRSTITVDGNLDESVWDVANDVNKTVIGSVDNTVKFGLLWDNSYLYVSAKVLDSNLYNDSNKVYEDDSIEIYIDGDHNKGAKYDAYDRQYIKGWNNSALWEKNGNTSGVQHAWGTVSGGYTIEMAIPWSTLGITPTENMTIGFDIGCNDDDNGSSRDGQAMWTGTAKNYLTTADFGEIVCKPAAPDTNAPSCSISINNDATYTNSTAVTLNLSATDDVGVTAYYLSTSATTPSSDSGWTSVTSTASYNASVSYTLSSGDGDKTVYVWYKDAAGNVSNTASDFISLDTTVPTITFTNPTTMNTYSTTQTTIELTGTAVDDSGISGINWSNDKGGSGTATGTTNWSVANISLSNGNNVITVTASDNAGNTGTATMTISVSGTYIMNGLQAYYSLDDGSGATARDTSNNNNTGTINGATWATGKNGGGLSFDGVNNYVRTSDSSSLAISGNAITLSVWVNYLNTNTHQIFIAKPYKEGSHLSPYFSYGMHGLFVNSTQIRPRFWLTIGNTAKSVTSSELVSPQTWYHLIGVYDGSTMKIFINGVERGSVSVTGAITSYATPLLIGANGGLTECFKGSIDDVRIYNRALSNQEVQDLYNGK